MLWWWVSEERLILLLISILICVVVSLSLKARGATLRKRLPPGPPALPVVGHLHLLGQSPHRFFCDLSKVYGPLMFFRLGSVPLIVASTPEMARQILRTHDQAFTSGRIQTLASEAIYGSCTGFVFSDTTPYLQFLRHLCTKDLFSSNRLEGFRPMRMEEVGALLRSVLADSSHGKLVSVRPKLQAATNNIICRMIIGKTSDVVPLLVEVIEVLGTLNLGDYIPFLRWMDLQGCAKHGKVTGARLHAALQAIIDGRREQSDGNYEPPADVLDVLLSASLNCPQNIQITNDHIKAVLLDLFAGASDTSSVLIEWALAELLTNPIQMKTLQEELQRVVGRERMVQDFDIPNMPLLMAVVKETMRLHPVLPFLVPRKLIEPCQISGYEIPANTQVYVNTWAVGRDPMVWEKALEFWPERFLDRSIDVRGQHFELLPFGSGRRMCPGWTLGLRNVQIILASLLQAFDWSVDEQDLDMSEKFGLVMTKAKPLLARVNPKLSPYIYASQQ